MKDRVLAWTAVVPAAAVSAALWASWDGAHGGVASGAQGQQAQSEGAVVAGGEEPRSIILIGWDGVGRENIQEGLDAQELPNLLKLSKKGRLVAIDVMRITDTKAGWTQILTGYEPERTGVFSNIRYDAIPAGLSVFARLESHFGDDGIVTAAVISKDKHMDTEGPQLLALENAKGKTKNVDEAQIVYDKGKAFVQIQAKPYFYTKDEADVFENGLGPDKAVGVRAMQLLEEHAGERFFFFVHFGETDRMGHAHGENSEQYRKAIVSADVWLGKIVAKLSKLGIAGRTLVYVTADHGFDEDGVKHWDAPYVWLATNDPEVKRRGERADVTPTILHRFGIDIGAVAPPLDGRPLTLPYKPPLF